MILDDICSLIVDTEHKTAPRQEHGYPSIRTPNIGRGRLDLEGVYRVSEETYKIWTRRATPQMDDLILAREAPVGNVAIIPEGLDVCLGQRTVLLRPNQELVSSLYLCYYLLSPKIQNRIISRSGGSTVSHLNMKDIRNLDIDELPPLPTQKRIASILSAYDDTIENNLKRIKLLEETAQNIYKEWFVNFRFPNFENTPFNEETGLPEGWELKIADNIYKINIGKTPPRGETQWFSTEEGVKWVSIADINKSSVFITQTNERITKDGVQKFNMRLANEGSVLLSFKLTVGSVVITSEEVVTNEAIAHFNMLENSTLSKEYTYCFLKNFNYQSLGSTSSIGTSINSKIVKSMKIVLPTENVISEFTDSVEKVFKQIQTLTIQNQKLKEARDILLPRLMNRTIEV